MKNVDNAILKIKEYLKHSISEATDKRREGAEEKKEFYNMLKWLILRTIDNLWVEHLEALEYIRDAVRLRAYGQRDPLAEYKNEGARMFEEFEYQVVETVISSMLHISIHRHYTPSSTMNFNLGDGVMQPSLSSKKEVGRNDPCVCGSGKKYKKCCGK